MKRLFFCCLLSASLILPPFTGDAAADSRDAACRNARNAATALNAAGATAGGAIGMAVGAEAGAGFCGIISILFPPCMLPCATVVAFGTFAGSVTGAMVGAVAAQQVESEEHCE